MRKAALALAAAAAVAGCNRQSTYEPPRTSAPPSAADDTWVAQPSELSAEQVRLVQNALTSRGFQVDASGTFDAATQTALADFQRSRGLPATGNVNADTAAALGLDPGEVRPSRGSEATAGQDRTTEDAPRRPGPAPDASDARTEPSTATGSPAVDR